MGPRCRHRFSPSGYTLIELMVVLALIGVLLMLGAMSLSPGVARQEARGAAQSCQAAAAWGQLDVLWRGGAAKVEVTSERISVTNDLGGLADGIGSLFRGVDVSANVPRWSTLQGVILGFGGPFASPDSGGSVYFKGSGGAYKVTVRPESGLTARAWVKP